MSLGVIDKYIAKKERDLLDYAKFLEEIITIEDNKMWKNKKEFAIYAKTVIQNYAADYYFDNNTNREDPIKYSNDNINSVLKSIIKYCHDSKKESMLKEWKNEIFLLSVIICTACYLDFATNVVDGNYNDTKAKFKYLLNYLGKTKILRIKANKYWINDLFDSIKKHTNEDRRTFEIVGNENYSNIYHPVSKDLYYTVSLSYSIPNSSEFADNVVESIKKEYSAKFLDMSIELLTFQILKDLISNKEVGIYLLNADKDLKKPGIIKKLDNTYIKPYIRLLVPFDMDVKYQGLIKEFTDHQIPVIYQYDKTANVDSKIFDESTELLVLQEFIDNNLDNQSEFAKKNIKFVVKNKED